MQTTGDLIARFMTAKQALGLSPRTIETYSQRLARFEAWLHGRPLTRDNLRAYITSLRAEQLSPVTIAAYFRDVGIFCAWLVDEEIITSNPARKLAPRTPKSLPASYSISQIRALLHVCDTRDRAMILLLLDTGLRAGELAGLRRDAIDVTTGRFTVIGKGSKERPGFVSGYTLAALQDYEASRRDASPWLWPNRDGDPITRNGLYQMVRRAAIRAGIRDETRRLVHAARATFAKMYVQNGGDLESLRRLLGHESIQMAAYYARLADDELADKKRQINPLSRALPEAGE